MNVKRVPGFFYHYKAVAFLVVLLFVSIVYVLVHWGIMCTNLQAWNHVSTVCSLHSSGTATGILCGPLCSEKRIHSLACETLHAGKEAVFSANWEATRLVFKSSSATTRATRAEENGLFWTDESGGKRFPTEDEFAGMIRNLVLTKLNLTMNGEMLRRLGRLRTHNVETNPERRRLEMENVWPLLQENEYVVAIVYEDRDIFPQLVGTCGTFFAVEYVKPIQTPAAVLAMSDSRHEWARRLKLAVMILELLDELETSVPEPLHLCDVKINHFGLPPGGQRLKFLDLDAVLPRTVVGRLTGDGRTCEGHEDCDFFDCRSVCSANKRCETAVVNDNLQVVCEKVFLGWTLSGTIIIPGLLMSRHTTSALAVMLRQCANPTDDATHRLPRAAVPEDLKSRLYNTLNEMEQRITAQL